MSKEQYVPSNFEITPEITQRLNTNPDVALSDIQTRRTVRIVFGKENDLLHIVHGHVEQGGVTRSISASGINREAALKGIGQDIPRFVYPSLYQKNTSRE